MRDAFCNENHQDLSLRVSWIMVDELTRAGVWRDLRFPLPSRQTDGSSILSISVDAAREMANRVRTLREAGGHRKGLKKAYSHVIWNLMRAVNDYECRGLTEDPGYSVAQAASNDCGQQFDVGDRAFCASREQVVTITGKFGFWKVHGEAGKFFNETGRRFDCRWGYVVQSAEGEKMFVHAGDLYDADCKLRHLTIVRAHGEPLTHKVTS
jgi:hypothetical protein